MNRARAAKESCRARSETWLATATPIQDAERREGADDHRLAQADVAVAVLAVGADDGDDDDHQQRGRLGLDLAEADEDRQRRDEEDAAADADEAAGEAADEADQDRGAVIADAHERISSTAIATSSAAKR